MRRLRVLLDAGVLVDAQVRDVFLALAEAGLVEFRWSDGVLDELRTLLVDDMGRPPEGAERLCDALRGAFPLGEVASSDEALAARLAGDDAEGLHPLVAAVTAEADLLVSHDRRRFPRDDVLARWDLAVVSPGDALAELVELLGPAEVAAAVDGLGGGRGLTADELLDRLRAGGQVSPAAAIAIGAELDAAQAGELDGYLLAARRNEAQATVSGLLSRVADGDLVGMDRLLSEAGRMALGPTARLRHGRLQDLLFDVLVDPGAWSVAEDAGPGARPARAARRDAEVVRLTRRDDAGPRAATRGEVPAGGDALVDAVTRLENAGRSVAEAARGPLARRTPTVTFAVVATAEGWRVESVAADPG